MPETLETLVPPGETPQGEDCTAEAHEERPDGGMWEYPWAWMTLILVGSAVFAAFFVVRAFVFPT